MLSVYLFDTANDNFVFVSGLTRLQLSRDRCASDNYQQGEKNTMQNVDWLHLATGSSKARALRRLRRILLLPLSHFFFLVSSSFFSLYSSFGVILLLSSTKRLAYLSTIDKTRFLFSFVGADFTQSRSCEIVYTFYERASFFCATTSFRLLEPDDDSR